MTLGDLLQILRRDILHDRSDRIEGDDDHLWSDTTLVLYINEAQRRFARRSLCLRDGTSTFTTFPTVAYQKEYALHPSIFAVLSARFMGNGSWSNGVYGLDPALNLPAGTKLVHPDSADLGRGGHSQFEVVQQPDFRYFDVNNLSVMPPGKPMAFDTDEYLTADANGSSGVVNMRLYPLPSPDFSPCKVQLRVVREPVTALTTTDLKAVPEIPSAYHLYLLDYAAYLALRIVDHELGDPARAGEFLSTFEKHVEEARRESMRKMFAPQPWGFGRNGFNYVGN